MNPNRIPSLSDLLSDRENTWDSSLRPSPSPRSSPFYDPSLTLIPFRRSSKGGREERVTPPESSRWTSPRDGFRSLLLWILTSETRILMWVKLSCRHVTPDSRTEVKGSLCHTVPDTWFGPRSFVEGTRRTGRFGHTN